MLKYNLYLNDILRASDLIKKSIKNKKIEDFEKDRELIDASCMRLQIIGECINKLDQQFKEKYKKINWTRYLQTRNIIRHAYFAINTKIVWSILTKEIPKLEKDIKNILKKRL